MSKESDSSEKGTVDISKGRHPTDECTSRCSGQAGARTELDAAAAIMSQRALERARGESGGTVALILFERLYEPLISLDGKDWRCRCGEEDGRSVVYNNFKRRCVKCLAHMTAGLCRG